jgi:2-oxoglutarate ferredoxin oxidoreductase subunit alpha
LLTVWPFAENRIQELASRVKAFVVPEINMGQIALEVERCAGGKAQTILVPHAGGGLHDPDDVLEAIMRVSRWNREPETQNSKPET